MGAGAPVRIERSKTLPKTLPGAVCAQWVRCGRPNCKCARGELHGPYYYRFWREGGRLHKKYIKREDLDAVKKACERRRHERRELARAMQEYRRIVTMIRRVEDGR